MGRGGDRVLLGGICLSAIAVMVTPAAAISPYRYGDVAGETGVPYYQVIGREPAASSAAPQEVQSPPQRQAREIDPNRLNPTDRVMTIVAPLMDGANYLGDVEVRIDTDDNVSIAAAQVWTLLAGQVETGALEPLRSWAEPGVFAPLDRFTEAGLPVTFDPRSLELAIDVPAVVRPRQFVGLAELDREVHGDFATPEAITAYLNMRGSIDYVHRGAASGLGEPLMVFDGAARIHGVVLETEATWDGRDGAVSRDGTRLIYDDLDRLNRWTVGDLIPVARGFQGVEDMAGFSVARTYALLDPQRNVAPRGGRAFTIDRESTVDAFVNGRLVRTLRLQPGSYDVSNFPFVQGSNDVDLVIVDDTGRREVLSFSLFIDRAQLARGLSEYGFYAGVRSERDGRDIAYTEEAAASGFYRYGLNESLTIGGNVQYAESGALVGTEFVWGSPIGTIGADIAVSHLENVDSGWAINASWERIDEDDFGGTSLLATFEARSRRFGAPAQTNPDNPYAFAASVAANRSFGDSSFVGGQLRYARGRDGFPDEKSVRVTYGRRLSDSMNVILDVDWGDGGFVDGFGVRAALVRRFGETSSGRADYDTRSERARIGYQASGGAGVGAWSATANLDAAEEAYGLNGSATYAANRADLGLAHSTAYSLATDEISDQRTSLRIGSSVAFAGGRVAVGRPVTDSFVIVAPYDGGRDVVIEVEPAPAGYFARSGPLGPALYGQISSYSPRSITYDAANAPPGFDVGQGAVRVRPPHRAGYVVTVGSDYGLTVIGRLLDHTGAPLTLVAGVAIEEGGDGRRVDVFTNRQGAFGAGGLRAGLWRIEMSGGQGLAYQLLVAKTPDGVARVGDLRPVQ